ncbi:MAG: hypothetical protein HC806_01010 [Anaerolineae bacterium]|nr:hypothetical protein [Anaerolineae bacterium]
MDELTSHTVPWNQIRDLLKPDFRIHHSYFIPEDRFPILPPEIHSVRLLASEENGGSNGSLWHPDDILFTPLYKNDSEIPLGLISVDAPRNGMRPDRATIEALEIFANQAALTIERHLTIDTLRTRVGSLEGEVSRAQQASQQAQTQLPFLLRKELEQTISIQRLNLRSRRIQAVLEIIEAINQQKDRESIFQTLAQELITRMEVDIVLVTEPTRRGPVLSLVLGKVPEGSNPQALLGQRNPLRHSLRNNAALFAANMGTPVGEEWQGSPLLTAMKAESFFCMPILASNDANSAEAAILGISFAPVSEYTLEDQQVFFACSKTNLCCHPEFIAVERNPPSITGSRSCSISAASLAA